MPSYAVDGVRQAMTGTGIVEKVFDWIETPEGKRRPGETQARDEATGMPLWGVEVLYVQTSFGRKTTVTAKVAVGSVEEPKVAPLTPIGFSNLRVEVRTNKAGGFSEYWAAEGLLEPTKSSSGLCQRFWTVLSVFLWSGRGRHLVVGEGGDWGLVAQ